MAQKRIEYAQDNMLPRSQSGSTLHRMQSETIFGKNRGESAHSNNGGGGGSQARVIDMPKVVKGIHAQVASEDTLVIGERSEKTQPNGEATQKVKVENVTKQISEKIGGRQLTVERRKTFAG